MYTLDCIYIYNKSKTRMHDFEEKRFYHYSTMRFPKCEKDFQMKSKLGFLFQESLCKNEMSQFLVWCRK